MVWNCALPGNISGRGFFTCINEIIYIKFFLIMENEIKDFEMPQVKFVAIEVEQGFAVSGGPEMYTLAGGETF